MDQQAIQLLPCGACEHQTGCGQKLGSSVEVTVGCQGIAVSLMHASTADASYAICS